MVDQWKIDKVLNLLESEYETTVSDFVNKRGWKIDSSLVEHALMGELSESEVGSLEEALGSLSHKMDNRSAEEYGVELMLNWLLEDITAEILNKDEHITVQLSGEDKQREFLQETSADPDLEVQFDGNVYQLELATSYTNFWKRNGVIDLRDNKFLHIKETERSLLLGIDFSDDTVFISSPNQLSAEYTEEHDVWGKPAYRVDGSSVSFVEFDSMNTEFKKSALLI